MNEIARNIDKLREIALDQCGFVTARQAREVGVSKSALANLLARDRVDRVAHGVYRVPQVPATHNDRFMLAVLWTGAPEAVLSHESALDLYRVCDVNPRLVHVSVGKGRRIKRRNGEGYAVHYENVDARDATWRDGLPVVTLGKAIEQCFKAGTASYLLEQAVDEGVRQGYLSAAEGERLRGELEGDDAGRYMGSE